MKEKFEELTESFITNKVGISDSFLSAGLSAGLQKNILRLNRDSRMSRASIGNGIVQDKHQSVRKDKICWMDKKNNNAHELEFLDMIDQFIGYLNQTCFTSLNACEFHYSLYEEGGYYNRHKDQFRTNPSRKYSMISYLNENWAEVDGGQLLVHHEDYTQTIMPQSQRSIFFKSDELEHEVTIARRPRMSVTGWLKRV